jgi:phage shock protein A
MSLFAKLSLLTRANANDIVNKQIDRQSIPVITQTIADLEVHMREGAHMAAAAAANVTTLTNRQNALNTKILHDTATAKAFKAQGDLVNAKKVVDGIIVDQATVTGLTTDIANAKANSEHMDASQTQIKAHHDELVAQLHTLQTQDRNTKVLEGESKALAATASVATALDANTIGSMAQRITEKGDVAQEEFNRTIADFAPAAPADPIQAQASADLLNSL